jgi:hypothetical protein
LLEDVDGLVVASNDQAILNDLHVAPPHWAPGDTPLGVFLLRPAPGTPPGKYTLKLAIYDPRTMAPVPAAGDSATGALATLGHVELARAATPPLVSELPMAPLSGLSWNGVWLLGTGALPGELNPGDTAEFDLYWLAERAGLPDVRLRLALVNLSGTEFSLAEIAPVGGRYPSLQWAAAEIVRDHHRWRLDPATPPGDYQIRASLVDSTNRTASPAATLGSVRLSGRAHTFALPLQMGERSGIRIGEFAHLLGFELQPRAVNPGRNLTLTLYWQASGASPIPYTVFTQLLDVGGVLRAQRDQQPGNGHLPTTGWVPGEVLTDTYQLSLPASLAPGTYTLHVGMYDPVSGTRLPVFSAEDTPVGNAAPLATLRAQ